MAGRSRLGGIEESQIHGTLRRTACVLLLAILPGTGLHAQEDSCKDVKHDTRIALDNAGIANWTFQNPRRPYPIVHKRAGVGLVQAADETCFARGLPDAQVAFVNDTPDRLFEVRVPYTLPTTRVSDIVKSCGRSAPQGMAETLPLQGQTTTFDAACQEVAKAFNAGSTDEISLPLLEICSAHWLGSTHLSPEQAGAKAAVIALKANKPEYCALITSLFGDLSNASAFESAFSNACSKSPRGYDCTYSLQVGLGTTASLDRELLQYLATTDLSPGLLTFQVFFVGESELPSHNLGYLQVKPKFDEPQSSTVWQLSGSVGAATDADFNQLEPLAFNAASGAKEDAVSPFVSPTLPYRGAREDDFNGSASFKLIQKLGNRAEGSATLSFKSGNLGEADQERKAVVSDYSLRLFGDNGTQLRFGKYELATGRESIALLEKGEAAELLWRFASLGAVFKRENVDGPPAKKTEGSRSLVLQLKDLPLARLRSFNVLGVYGRNDGQPTFDNLFPSLPEAIADNERFVVAYNYKTVGGDASFALPPIQKSVISGNFAGYYSQRDVSDVTTKAGERIAGRVDPAGKIKDGDGKVALLSVVVARTGVTGKPSPSSFRLQVGWGSGDKAGTSENEGYLGETTGFVPDKIFIARLAPVIRGGLVSAGQGLANKTYTGLSYTDNQCHPWLPLVALARMIGIHEGITACNSQVRFHHYSLNEEVFDNRGKTAGDEVNLDFKVTVPKGVTTSLGFGRFRPGNALQDVVKGQPWVLTTGVSVTM